jgi:hypothetical protein
VKLTDRSYRLALSIADANANDHTTKAELAAVVHDPRWKGEIAGAAAVLQNYVGQLEELHDDEYGDENDGATRADLEAYLKDPSLVDGIDTQAMYYQQRLNAARTATWSALFTHEQRQANYRRVEQGAIGDCFFQAALAATVKANPMAPDQMITDNGDGTYTVDFPGIKGTVTVSSPTEGEFAMGATGYQDGIWAVVLEKAYAQAVHGGSMSHSYGKLDEGGDIADALYHLTGQTVQSDALSVTRDTVTRSRLKDALSKGLPVVASTTVMAGNDKITAGHAYTVISYDSKTDEVTIRDPRYGMGSGVEKMKLSDFTSAFSFVSYGQAAE